MNSPKRSERSTWKDSGSTLLKKPITGSSSGASRPRTGVAITIERLSMMLLIMRM
jgi:hypothetical protein